MFAPIDEPGIVILLDVDSALPLTITASFRPRLRLMWPAPSMTGGCRWDADAHLYTISEETGRFAGVIGSPVGARRVGDAVSGGAARRPEPLRHRGAPSTRAGSSAFRSSSPAASKAVRRHARPTTGSSARSGRSTSAPRSTTSVSISDTLSVATPDPRLNTAFAWAKVGIDKGLATNPLLGTGLVAGFRTSGDSERPGFAWFFGRDALWTTLALDCRRRLRDARGRRSTSCASYQRQDGKIPHEISQCASLVPWFDQFPYAWASADATPLYVIAHADYWRAQRRSRIPRAGVAVDRQARIASRRPPTPTATA